jgi:hypothetical protein
MGHHLGTLAFGGARMPWWANSMGSWCDNHFMPMAAVVGRWAGDGEWGRRSPRDGSPTLGDEAMSRESHQHLRREMSGLKENATKPNKVVRRVGWYMPLVRWT